MSASSRSARRIASRFEVLRKLGEGGMGVVYEAYDHVHQIRVALKTIRRVSATSLYRFKREFRALCDISHPNIVALYELIADGERWLLSMELLDGVHVLDHVRSRSADEMTVQISRPQGTPAPEYEIEIELEPASRSLSLPADTAVSEMPSEEIPTRGRHGRPAEAAEHIATTEVSARSHPGASMATQSMATRLIRNIREGKASPADRSPQAADADRPTRHVGDMVDLDHLYQAALQLARGLHAIHAAGLVHRDLKPSNVMVTRDGRAVLMDFGIVAELKQLRQPGEDRVIVGTPAYMAPEQVQGEPPTAAADWYAFGVLLYQALTGTLPYAGTSREILVAKLAPEKPVLPSALIAGIDEGLERLCMQLLAHDPKERPGYREIVACVRALAGRAGERRPPKAHGHDHSGVLSELEHGERALFVGRAAESDWLRTSYEAAQTRGLCAVVIGPSGMGKTTLLERFVVESRAVDDAVVLSGRCHERESIAYKAFDGVIDELAGYLLNLPEGRRDALWHADLSALARLFPALSQVPGLTAPAGSWDEDPAGFRERAVGVLRRVLAAMAARAPVIIRIEDLHWADSDSFLLLRMLVGEALPGGVMVAATVRSEALDAEPRSDLSAFLEVLMHRGMLRELRLGPLNSAEQRELAWRVSEATGARMALDEGVWSDSEGHPMLLSELVRFASAHRNLARPGDGNGDDADRHASLEEILWHRVAALPADARALAEAMAIAGEPMPLPLLAQAAELGDANEKTHRAATALLAERLARTSGRAEEPWLGSYHDKVGEAVLARLSHERAQGYHRRLAEALLAWGKAPAGAVARHVAAAGDMHKAAVLWLAAAAEAAEKVAPHHAVALYGQALQCLASAGEDRPDIENARLRCQAELGLAQLLRVTTENVPEALDHVARAEALAKAYGFDDVLSRIYYLRGSLLFACGDMDGCMRDHREAMRYAKASGSVRDEAHALSGLGDAYLMRAHMISANRHYAACVDLCRAHGFAELGAVNLALVGFTRFFLGETVVARQSLLAAKEMAEHLRSPRGERIACTVTSMVLLNLGELDMVRSVCERTLAESSRFGGERHLPIAYGFLARALFFDGRRDEARAVLAEAMAQLSEAGMAFSGANVLGALALVEDDPGRAWAFIAQAEALLKGRSMGQNRIQHYHDAMEVGLAWADYDAVLRYAAALEQLTRDEPLAVTSLLVDRARVLVQYGRGAINEETRAELRRIYAETERLGLRIIGRALAKALAALGESPYNAGD